MKQEGMTKLHILADFDRTLTRSFINGEKKSSILAMLRDGGYLSAEYRQKAYDLFDKYNPIEIDLNVPMDEKIEKMTQWWLDHLDLLVQSGLSKKDVSSIANSSMIKLRPGIQDFLHLLEEKEIPIVILSANGLGRDSISLYLKKEKFIALNIHIISNAFIWDENGKAIGYDKRVIHSFNKGERILSDYPEIYNEVQTRTNVVLLGDSLGDPDMIESFEYDNLIKIGFLNEKEEKLLDIYKEKYDVVLTGDDDGYFVNEILR